MKSLIQWTATYLSEGCASWQVWDNTPSVGEAPFLDSIWTALDEVQLVPLQHVTYIAGG